MEGAQEGTGTPGEDTPNADRSDTEAQADGNPTKLQEAGENVASVNEETASGEVEHREGEEGGEEEKDREKKNERKTEDSSAVNDLPQETETAQNGASQQSDSPVEDLEHKPHDKSTRQETDTVRPSSDKVENNRILTQTDANTTENPNQQNGDSNQPDDTGTPISDDGISGDTGREEEKGDTEEDQETEMITDPGKEKAAKEICEIPGEKERVSKDTPNEESREREENLATGSVATDDKEEAKTEQGAGEDDGKLRAEKGTFDTVGSKNEALDAEEEEEDTDTEGEEEENGDREGDDAITQEKERDGGRTLSSEANDLERGDGNNTIVPSQNNGQDEKRNDVKPERKEKVTTSASGQEEGTTGTKPADSMGKPDLTTSTHGQRVETANTKPAYTRDGLANPEPSAHEQIQETNGTQPDITKKETPATIISANGRAEGTTGESPAQTEKPIQGQSSTSLVSEAPFTVPEMHGKSVSGPMQFGDSGANALGGSISWDSFSPQGPASFSFSFGQTSTPLGSEDTSVHRLGQHTTPPSTTGRLSKLQPARFIFMDPGNKRALKQLFGSNNSSAPQPSIQEQGNTWATFPGKLFNNDNDHFGGSPKAGPLPAQRHDFNGLKDRNPADTGLPSSGQTAADDSANAGSVSAGRHDDSTAGETSCTPGSAETFVGSAYLQQDSGRGDSLYPGFGNSDHFDNPEGDHQLKYPPFTNTQTQTLVGAEQTPYRGYHGQPKLIEEMKRLEARLSQVLQELDDQKRMMQEEKKNSERLQSEYHNMTEIMQSLKTESQNKDYQIKGLHATVNDQREKCASVEKLERDYGVLQRQFSEIQQRCSSQEAMVTEKEAALSAERQNHAEDIRHQQTQQRELRQQLQHLQQTSQEEIAHLTELRETLSADRDSLSAEVKELTEEKSSLQSTRNGLEEEVQRLKASLLDNMQEQERLRGQLSQLSIKSDSLNAQNLGLQDNMAELRTEKEKLQQAKDDLQEQVGELRTEVETKDTQIKALTRYINQQEQTVTAAEEVVDSLEEARQSLEQSQQKCASLEKRLEEATTRIQETETELQQSSSRLALATEELETLRARLVSVKSEEDELRSASQDQLSKLTADRDAVRAEHDRLLGLVEELTNARTHLEEEKSDLEGQLRRTDEEKNNLITARHALETQRNSSEAAVQELTESTRRLEDLNRTLQGQLTSLEAQVQAKENLAGGLSDTVARQERELQTKEQLEREHQNAVRLLIESQQNCTTLQSQVTELTNNSRRLEEELARKIEDHRSEANALKVRVHELSSELEALNQSSQKDIASLVEVRSTLRSDNDRLNVTVDELQNNKRRLEDQKRDLQERLRATERKAEELTTTCRVLELQKRTAEEQSVTYGQSATILQAKSLQQEDLANSYRSQTLSLTAALRQKTEQVLPLEMEARRAGLEVKEITKRLGRMTTERTALEGIVNALKEEADQSAVAIREGHKREEELKKEVEKQLAQKVRYLQEMQSARGQIKTLEARVRRFHLQEAQRFRRNLPSLE